VGDGERIQERWVWTAPWLPAGRRRLELLHGSIVRLPLASSSSPSRPVMREKRRFFAGAPQRMNGGSPCVVWSERRPLVAGACGTTAAANGEEEGGRRLGLVFSGWGLRISG
jgi:hypothetical protein